jgi:hypothetical protein
MDEIKQLLRDYLAGMLDSEEFVVQYLSLAQKLWDVQRVGLNRKSRIRDQFDQLVAQRDKGAISQRKYLEKWKLLAAQIEEVELKPYSKEDQTLSHLWNVGNNYREDPKERQAGGYIGDDDLRAEVEKALDQLG